MAINVRDLIIDTTNITANEQDKPKAKRNAPKPPEWEIVLQDACDAAVRRKTARTSRLLVLLMSQGQFYIKDEKTGEVEDLNATNLKNFLAGQGDTLRPVPWSSCFNSTANGAMWFIDVIHNENFQWLAKRGAHVYNWTTSRYRDYSASPYELKQKRQRLDSPLPKMVRKLAEEIVGSERANELYTNPVVRDSVERKLRNLIQGERIDEVGFINEKFGLDWTRAYLRSFVAAPFTGDYLPRLSRYASELFDITNFDRGRFVEYLLNESARQGYGAVTGGGYQYGSDVEDFARTWKDTLQMQKRIYGKVVDKYPNELDTLHRRLSFRCTLMRTTIDENAFKRHSERLAANEKKDKAYLIRPPFNKNDILDEAAQQANCLASYVDAYTEDRTDLYFMRDVNEPDKSLVTVEVRNGAIRQAYRKCNQRPSVEEVTWLNEWAAERDIQPIDVGMQHPMCA